MRSPTKRGWVVLLIGVSLIIASPGAAEEVKDPFQGWNRKMFWFNEQLDRVLIAPVARGWVFITPELARRGLRNVFDNVRMPITLVNDVLQLKPHAVVQDLGRIIVNSSFGLGGLIDVATIEGVDNNIEDFGQTLGYWGMPPGPYLVWPILGPSSPRGTVGFAADMWTVPHIYFIPWWANGVVFSTRVVNERSFYLGEISQAREESMDFYLFARDTYIQYREKQVRDGVFVDEEEEDDLYYFDEELEEMHESLEESDAS